MFLQRLKIRGFRNLEHVDLELGQGINIFVGANAQGKTSLLEAVHFLATATSHRTKRTQEFIHHSQAVTFVEGCWASHSQTDQPASLTISCGLEASKKLFKINHQPLPRLADLYGHIAIVFMAPEDLELVTGRPYDRRRFLDIAISQEIPSHIDEMNAYGHALRQRNSVLRQGGTLQALKPLLEVYSAQMIVPGCRIIQHRHQFTQRLGMRWQTHFDTLSAGKEKVSLCYRSELGKGIDELSVENLAQQFQAKMEATLVTDMTYKNTTFGPHRDDLEMRLNNKSLKTYGSQGQRRSGALSLRVAELQCLHEHHGKIPLVLIDDVIHEMDMSRRTRFLESFKTGGQVLITVTDLQPVSTLLPQARIFDVCQGVVTLREQPTLTESS